MGQNQTFVLKASFPGRPKKCDVTPRKHGGACEKRRKHNGMLCKSCTAWQNAK